MSRVAFAGLSIVAFGVAATPAVVYAHPAAGLARTAVTALVIAGLAAGLFATLRRRHPTPASFATALGFAVLTPLSGEHAPWATGSAVHVYAVQRDVNTLMPAMLIGGIGALMLPRRRRVAKIVATLAGAGVIATLLGAPGDLRLLALPFWWHVPGGVRTIQRMLAAPRADRMPRVVGVVTMAIGAGYLWFAARLWTSGVGVALSPLL
jgi:hypothetical protein